MLGKQWLSRYDSIDLRGSAIERSQDRQRKLNGINAWYFDQVIGSLPLMLQAALLLLACALSKYLWEIDTTVAAVVVGVTSFGVLFYLLIVVAGAASVNCPYQTPAADLIRRTLCSAYGLFVRHSVMYKLFTYKPEPNYFMSDLSPPTCCLPITLPVTLIVDIFNFVRLVFWIPVKLALRVYTWRLGRSLVPDRALDNRVTELNLHCASWILQTSSDITIQEVAFNFLETILPLSGLSSSSKPAILVESFNIFGSCLVRDNGYWMQVANGLEQLAERSAMCLLLTYSSVLTTEPMSTVIRDMHKRYKRIFPSSRSLPSTLSPITVKVVFVLVGPHRIPADIDWRCFNPPIDELISFSRALVQIAHFKSRTPYELPEWLIEFAFRFLSQEPLPPTPVVVECLTLIAIGLGCNVSDANNTVSNERCVYPLTTIGFVLTRISARLEQIFNLTVQKHEGITSPRRRENTEDWVSVALLSYAFQRGENGAGELQNMLFQPP